MIFSVERAVALLTGECAVTASQLPLSAKVIPLVFVALLTCGCRGDWGGSFFLLLAVVGGPLQASICL